MATEVKQCTHYWLIERTHSLESRGVCRVCGETRMFVNVLDFSTAESQRKHFNPWQIDGQALRKMDRAAAMAESFAKDYWR